MLTSASKNDIIYHCSDVSKYVLKWIQINTFCFCLIKKNCRN